MALPLDRLGTTYDERIEVVDPDRVVAYAEATNDPNDAYRSGPFAPPVFVVVPTWEAMGLAVADVVPAEALGMVVHGEQDIHLHQPLRKGMTLSTQSLARAVRVGRTGTRFTIEVASVDGLGAPVATQYVTMFIRGLSDGEGGGPDAPAHELPEQAREHVVGTHAVHVDDDQTFRYRDASGDRMPIHVDDAFARSVGLPGIIAHGLCTMAMASQSVLALTADGDPSRLRRLAVRFAANVFPGSDVTTTVFDAGPGQDGLRIHPFESTSRDVLVVKHGWAEVG